MDRLTYRSPRFNRPVSKGACLDVKCGEKCDDCKIGEIISRLCEYEDTGLEPVDIERFKENYNMAIEKYADYAALGTVEEAKELFFAKGGGRLVMLPCKITDTVYVIESMFYGMKVIGKRVVSAQIEHVAISRETGTPVFGMYSETRVWHNTMEPGSFYLTREEAEKALKEQEENG